MAISTRINSKKDGKTEVDMNTDIHQHRILILDFGSQYTQLIARRVREVGVYCEIYTFDSKPAAIKSFNPSGVILSGGPESVTHGESARAPKCVFEMNIPILGICYGMQTMAEQLGGRVARCKTSEFGYAEIRCEGASRLFQDIEDRVNELGTRALDVWMSHGDAVVELPNGFRRVAQSDSSAIAAMEHSQNPWFGIQFHPEVTHTLQGLPLFERFVLDICQCDALWTSNNIAKSVVAAVRKKVGGDSVLLGLSGGVDSSVLAKLLHLAVGDQLVCVFVDNGLLRQNEGDQVMEMFAQNMGVRVIRVDAEEIFFSKLRGIVDPEEKRKTIGSTFIEVFDEEAKKLGPIRWLAQGTIYPDVIESAGAETGKAQIIKSHHNVGGLPKTMSLDLLEPLRELFKDEVRQLGLELKLPKEMVFRHPFPGPGLGVRIMGEVKREFASLLRDADAIFIEELRLAGWYDRTSQAFAVFLPVRSVGVVGDQRRYEWVIALRAVQTVDFMTARWAHLPGDLLETVSNRIINEISGIARVTYDISGKPPATIEWE